MRCSAAPPLPARRTDLVEDLVAWLLTSLGLLAVLGAVLVGQAAHHAALGRAGAVSPVVAVVHGPAGEHAAAPAPDQRIPAPRTHVLVSWRGIDGIEHVATAEVPPRPAGATVTVWVDDAGRVVADPAERSAEAWAFGISAGLTVVALTWALLTLLWSAVCRVTTACNAAGWAREWARVEPRWRRSVR
jgi:hypothetical protein